MEAPDAREETAAEPRVYIPRQDLKRQGTNLVPGIDTSKAESFGRRIYVLQEDTKPWNPAKGLQEARAVLEEFDAATDYLLLIGPPILCAVVLMVAAERARFDGYTHVRCLYWYGRDGAYGEVPVPVDAKTDWED